MLSTAAEVFCTRGCSTLRSRSAFLPPTYSREFVEKAPVRFALNAGRISEDGPQALRVGDLEFDGGIDTTRSKQLQANSCALLVVPSQVSGRQASRRNYGRISVERDSSRDERTGRPNLQLLRSDSERYARSSSRVVHRGIRDRIIETIGSQLGRISRSPETQKAGGISAWVMHAASGTVPEAVLLDSGNRSGLPEPQSTSTDY